MCGIVGFVGRNEQAEQYLLSSLRTMSYRGYDSAGVAVYADGKHHIRKEEGKLQKLQDIINNNPLPKDISSAVGHIRWATHGKATKPNAHPHASKDIVLVHNGIIENWAELKQELLNENISFASETDTEVVVHLLQKEIDAGRTPLQAVENITKKLKGAYALAIHFLADPEHIYAVKYVSPLIIGFVDGQNWISSDVMAIADKASNFMRLQDGDIVMLSATSYQITNEGQKVDRKVEKITAKLDDHGKGDFDFFMQKEIFEQPKVIETLNQHYLDLDKMQLQEMNLPIDPKQIDKITIVACGTAYNAAVVASYWIEHLAKIPCHIDIASEYRYRDLIVNGNELIIGVSQSGETADTLGAIEYAKQKGMSSIAVLNVLESTMGSIVDHVLPLLAGIEVGVASTKAYTAQTYVLLMVALHLAKQRGQITADRLQQIINSLLDLPKHITSILNQDNEIKEISKSVAKVKDVLYIGRHVSFATALEGSLKLKELSYLHAEAFPSGELKHGSLALVDENVMVVGIAPNDSVFDKTISNIQEVAARNGQVIMLSEEGTDVQIDAQNIYLPKFEPILSPLLYVVPLQLIAFHTSNILGKDVDQPRNLAKSVTVE